MNWRTTDSISLFPKCPMPLVDLNMQDYLHLIDKKGYLRSRVDSFGNPIIYYRGAITEEQGMNGEGEEEQISLLKKDIEKLLKE